MTANRLFNTLFLALLTGQIFAQRETKLNGAELAGTWELAAVMVRCPPEDTASRRPSQPATLKFYENGQMQCSDPRDMFFGGMVKWSIEEMGTSIGLIKSGTEGSAFWPKTNASGDIVLDLTKLTDSCGYVPSVYTYRKVGGIDFVRKVEAAEVFVLDPNGPVFEQSELDTAAVFGRGESSLIRYISMNLTYPALARENGVQGTVLVEFIVERDGSLSNFKILKDIGSGCGEEALRLFRAMPKWRLAVKGGQSVRARVKCPVIFKLG